MEALLVALQGALPGAVRVGSALRLPEHDGSVRVIEPRSPHDPQIDHGLIVGFAPALEEGLTLGACHLRGRCRRSVDAIEAARAYAEGRDVEASAKVLAGEAVQQLSEVWAPFLAPAAWVGPSVEDLLRQNANASPADVEPLLALVRAAAQHKLGAFAAAREWLVVARRAADPRVRQALGLVQKRLADA